MSCGLARQAEWNERQRLREERRAAARERVSIHVKGAPRGLDAEKVAKIFAPFGDVARVKLWYANGPSPSAVLSMGTAEQAAAAIAMLGGRKLEGCVNPMTITVARRSGGKGAKASSESSESSDSSLGWITAHLPLSDALLLRPISVTRAPGTS